MQPKSPAVILHRANMLKNYNAIAGIKGVEFDVQLTGGTSPQPVIYHDRYLPDKREVSSLSYGDLFAYEGIVVRFDEYLNLFQTSHLFLYIELKGENIQLIQKLLPKLEKKGLLTDNMMIASFSAEQIKEAHAVRQSGDYPFLIGYIIQAATDKQSYIDDTFETLPSVEEIEQQLGFIPDVLSADRRLFAAEKSLDVVDSWRNGGRQLAVWTVNDVDEAKRLSPYVDIVVTDEAAMMVDNIKNTSA